MTQYQDPEEKELEPTPQILKARQVLEELDEMRASGASTQAQFEFLRKKLPQNDDLEDDRTPIDVRLERQEEARAGFRRVQEAMKNLMATWDGSTVLPTETKEVGNRLLSTLDQMRRHAEDAASKHWKSEVEMLAELWPSAPDVGDYFQCSPIRAPAKLKDEEERVFLFPEEEADVEETKKLARDHHHEKSLKEAAEQALEEPKWSDEIRARGEPSVRGFLVKKEPESEPTEKVVGSVFREPAVKEAGGLELERPGPETKEEDEVVGTVQAHHDARGRKELELKAKEEAPSEKLKQNLSEPVKKDEGPDHLRRDAWAEALREMTALPWKFDRELHGRTGDQGLEGDVLHFIAPATMSARLMMISMSCDIFQVTLDLHIDGKWHHLTETLMADEVENLHLDPIPFVKKTLKTLK